MQRSGKRARAGVESHRISHLMQKQNPKFNNAAFLKLGSLETPFKEMHPGWGPGGLDHHFIKNSQ